MAQLIYSAITSLDGHIELDAFTDVRELQRQQKAQRIAFESEADESTTGPASFIILDPDGNPLLFDQHVRSRDRLACYNRLS